MTDFQLVEGPQAALIDPTGFPWNNETAVLFAIEDGRIVGRTAFVEFCHIEGSWVAEDKRGGTLAYRLVSKMESIAADMGRDKLCAYAWDNQPEVSEYLGRIGYEKQPLTVWVKRLHKEAE